MEPGASNSNLFLRLHKWAKHQDENFLTESLAVVLEHLLVLAPTAGKALVAKLTGNFIGVSDDADSIEIRTQVVEERGRLDLEICTVNRRVWVEVKVESGLGPGQLEKYSGMLRNKSDEQNRLVLLTRYPEEDSSADPDIRKLRWFQFADWLESEMNAISLASDTANFLAQQFLDFLEERGMTIERVEHYMPEGIRALSNLMNMLNETAVACNVPVKPTTGWGYVGLILDRGKYYVTLGFEEPGRRWFSTCRKINPEAAAKLGVGEVWEENWVPGHNRWGTSLDLDSEQIHFFYHSKVGQMKLLEDWLQDCLSKASSIENPE